MLKQTPNFLILFICLCYSASAFAQIGNIERQDQQIRQQQAAEEREERQKNFENVAERKAKHKEEKKLQSSKLGEFRNESCVAIKNVKIVGANSLAEKVKQESVNGVIGKCLEQKHVATLINELNEHYYEIGLITSRFNIPKQDMSGGEIVIEVTEGRIGKIILGEDKFSDKMQKVTAFGLIEGEILDLDDIKQGVAQINRLPSQNAKVEFEKGSKEGYHNIIVTNESSLPVSAKIGYDNLGNEFSGVRRANFSSSFDNMFSLNDQSYFEYNANLDDPNDQKDQNLYSAGISIPFAYNTLSYDFSKSDYLGSGDTGSVGLSGYSRSSEFAISRVLQNKQTHHLSAKLSLATKDMASYLNGAKLALSERSLTVGNLSVAFTKYLPTGGYFYLQPQYIRGLTILGADKDASGASSSTPKAQYEVYKIYAYLAKEFEIPKLKLPASFTVEIDSQLSRDTLFGSEQFAVGGYYSVRGFRENFIAGDHGYYIKNDLAFNLGKFLDLAAKRKGGVSEKLHKIELSPFFDYGYAETKASGDGGRLAGTGLAAKLATKYFDASLTYSWAVHRSNLILSDEKENKIVYFELTARPF